MKTFFKKPVMAGLLLLAGIAWVKQKLPTPEESAVEVTGREQPANMEAETEEPEDGPEIVRLKETAWLPSRYDYREEGRTGKVWDQGLYGTCWAFASLTALETGMLPEEQLDFSRDHLNYHNSFLLAPDDGGSYLMSMSYLTAWQGPVLDQNDPYGDGISPDGLSAVRHVQEVRVPDAKDYETVKQTLYLHGGVETSLYIDFFNPQESSAYYDPEHASYCYNGGEQPNHDVVIVGWDDDYPAENFKVVPEGNGAFICQNSWGTHFGEDGFFYVSYFDTNVGVSNVAYTKVEAADNYDVLHQSDLCGWSGQIGYDSAMGCFANVYQAQETEILRAVGFYAVGGDTEYQVAVISDFESVVDLIDPKYVQAGYLQYPGYYTVELNESVQVDAGKKFAVVIQITTPGSTYPIAIEYAAEELGDAVILTDGQGYISSDGSFWENVEEAQESNLCLKVYADLEE